MHYDLIVVGAGPGGSSTAYWAGRLGLKVLLIEKHKLPRFKLCAGCLSKRVDPLLPQGWKELVLSPISHGLLGYKGEEYAEVYSEEPVAYIVDRASFDAFLTNCAREVGVEFMGPCEFLGFEKEGGRYKVFTSRGVFFSDFLVGADGFHSKVGKALGYKKEKFFKSLEFFTEGELEDRVVIEIGVVRRGYLWVFPRGEGISVGVASTHGEDLLGILRSYSARKGIRYAHPKGWHIPFAEKEGDFHLGKERVLLVGDAANMTDPLLGEGIYYALWGGKLLAQAIKEDPSNPVKLYSKLLKPIKEELLYAGKIARLAYSFQRTAFKMGKGHALKSFFKLLEGEKTYKSLYK
ncbi:MAG: geranylgeranyl reductase family protein, partial [Aquificota bacterium]